MIARAGQSFSSGACSTQSGSNGDPQVFICAAEENAVLLLSEQATRPFRPRSLARRYPRYGLISLAGETLGGIQIEPPCENGCCKVRPEWAGRSLVAPGGGK